MTHTTRPAPTVPLGDPHPATGSGDYAVVCLTSLGTVEWCGLATATELADLVGDDWTRRLTALENGGDPTPVDYWVVFPRDTGIDGVSHPVCFIEP